MPAFTIESLGKFAAELQMPWKRDLPEFTKKIAEAPVFTFAWSRTSMAQAADYEVGRYIEMAIKGGLEHGGKPEAITLGIIEHAISEVLRKAEVNESTSHTSNYMERYTTAAWAKLATKQWEWARFSSRDDNVIAGFGVVHSTK